MFGSKSWKSRWFVLQTGGVLQYYNNESDWVAGAPPLKDALYQVKACTVAADGGGAGSGGGGGGSSSSAFKADEFGIIVQPRSAQGGPRRLLLRAPANFERERWMEALTAYSKPKGSS